MLTSTLGLPVLLQQHQEQHEWLVSRLPQTLRRKDYTVQGRDTRRVGCDSSGTLLY